MAGRVADRSGGSRIAAFLALAGLAGTTLLSGCEQEDPSATALSDAAIQIRTISPGSVPPTNDEFATARYRTASGKLDLASRDGSDAQKAIAAILTAEIAVGNARPEMTRLAELEHQIGMKLTRMTSLETARVSAQQTAEALGSYDPSAERTAIDQQASQLQQQLADAQAEEQRLTEQVRSLDAQISDLESQVSTIRGQESALRDRAMREEPIAAAQTSIEAREVGRRADGLEVQASNLDARRSVLGPQIEALNVRIDAINARLAILSEAREAVTAQAQRSTMEAREAREMAQEFAAELVALASEVSALHQDEAQSALESARQALEKAASSGRRASAEVVDGTLVAAGASRSLGDLLARRAASLEQTASVFSGLAQRGDGEQARRMSGLAGELSQRAETLRDDAISAYESAVSGLRRVRAQGSTRDALQKAADDIEAAIARLGGGSGEAEPVDQDGGAAEGEQTGTDDQG